MSSIYFYFYLNIFNFFPIFQKRRLRTYISVCAVDAITSTMLPHMVHLCLSLYVVTKEMHGCGKESTLQLGTAILTGFYLAFQIRSENEFSTNVNFYSGILLLLLEHTLKCKEPR